LSKGRVRSTAKLSSTSDIVFAFDAALLLLEKSLILFPFGVLRSVRHCGLMLPKQVSVGDDVACDVFGIGIEHVPFIVPAANWFTVRHNSSAD